jgi:hypothetical protein
MAVVEDHRHSALTALADVADLWPREGWTLPIAQSAPLAPPW